MQDIIVFSDYICPFCYIGKQRVERLAKEFPFRIIWKGFEIHPEVPPEGIPLQHFMPEMLSNLETRIRILAEEIDLEMQMPEKLANSHLALLGAEHAREIGVLEEYHEAIFRAYFQQGKDIGKIETLVDIWSDIDINSISFREALMSEKYEPLLGASIAEARSRGIHAVPSFVFADGNIIAGAQPYDTFCNAAERALRHT
jgi:predicted DsbA family dithiol-disulfide isomerase